MYISWKIIKTTTTTDWNVTACVPKKQIDNKSALSQVMSWHRAFTWTSGNLSNLRSYASPDHNAFITARVYQDTLGLPQCQIRLSNPSKYIKSSHLGNENKPYAQFSSDMNYS